MAYIFYYVCAAVLILVYICNGQVTDSKIDTFTAFQSKSISEDAYLKQVSTAWNSERMRAARPITELRPMFKFNRTVNNDTLKQFSVNNELPTMVSGTLPDSNGLLNRAFSLKERIVITVGKAFIETIYGDASCSASVVTSPSNSLIVTAAHCVFDLDTYTWYNYNWIFAPAYDNGVYPLGYWNAKYFTALKGYTQSSSSSPGWNYDVAFIVLYPNSNKKIAQVTGSQGIGFSLGYSQPIISFGYPVNIADTEIMSDCFGKALAPKCGVVGYIGQAIHCGMSNGCSGGPWVQNFNINTGLGYVTSVNSYSCDGIDPYMLHGAYFETNIKTLYNSVKSTI